MKIFKQIIKGMLVAITGAFAWAVLAFELSEKGSGESRLLFCLWIAPLAAAYAVLITSWFVLPIGGLLGVVTPLTIRNCSRNQAFVRGFFLGVCVGLIATTLTTIFMQWPEISGNATIVDRQAYFRLVRGEFIGYLTMLPICAIWIGAWAWRLAKK